MAAFAEIDQNNIVLRVVFIDDEELLDSNSVEQEALGVSYCEDNFGAGTWLFSWSQTSGIVRGTYAHTGFSYDGVQDVFLRP